MTLPYKKGVYGGNSGNTCTDMHTLTPYMNPFLAVQAQGLDRTCI